MPTVTKSVTDCPVVLGSCVETGTASPEKRWNAYGKFLRDRFVLGRSSDQGTFSPRSGIEGVVAHPCGTLRDVACPWSMLLSPLLQRNRGQVFVLDWDVGPSLPVLKKNWGPLSFLRNTKGRHLFYCELGASTCPGWELGSVSRVFFLCFFILIYLALTKSTSWALGWGATWRRIEDITKSKQFMWACTTTKNLGDTRT